jgi:hypothetical protein
MFDQAPPPTGWVSVVSSNVDAIRWVPDPRFPALHVKFKNGKIYRYAPAGPDVFWDMLGSSSKGRFVHWILKPRYRVSRVDS